MKSDLYGEFNGIDNIESIKSKKNIGIYILVIFGLVQFYAITVFAINSIRNFFGNTNSFDFKAVLQYFNIPINIDFSNYYFLLDSNFAIIVFVISLIGAFYGAYMIYSNNEIDTLDEIIGEENFEYADFWKRVLAFIIDFIFLNLGGIFVISIVVGLWFGKNTTVGYMVFGINAYSISKNGYEKLTIKECINYPIFKSFNYIIFGLGFFIPFFNKRKQALHNIMGNTVVGNIKK